MDKGIKFANGSMQQQVLSYTKDTIAFNLRKERNNGTKQMAKVVGSI